MYIQILNIIYIQTPISKLNSIYLSILLMHKVIGTFSRIACFISRSVFIITPSAASTKSTQPSLRRNAAVTSSLKLTWPGVSIILSRKFLPLVSGKSIVTGWVLIVTPRSISVKSVSVYRRSLLSIEPTSEKF